jgi:hypothetical protein
MGKTQYNDFLAIVVAAGIWASKQHVNYLSRRRVVCLFFSIFLFYI